MSKLKSKKRQRLCSSAGGTVLDATFDDFEEESLSFRFHKKLKADVPVAKKKRGRSKTTSSANGSQSKSSASKLVDSGDSFVEAYDDDIIITNEKICTSLKSSSNVKTQDEENFSARTPDEEDLSTKAGEADNFTTNSESCLNEVFQSDDEQTDFIALEKSICSDSEKLCPSCKHIVESSLFANHFSNCIKKFSYSKGKILDHPKKEEIFPCPVCLKTFNSKGQRHSHVKSCAQVHGLTSEQLILASRLQEKQVEERLSLGLPIHQGVAADLEKKEVKHGTAKNKEKDPDLELAVALSCSLAEEEKEKREQEENALLELGVPILVQEKRRNNHFVFPQSSQIVSQVKPTKRKKNGKLLRTVLMTRTEEDREKIISEKVASILAIERKFSQTETDLSVEAKGSLKHYQDKDCRLWNFSHSDCNISNEYSYVSELQNFIQKQELSVGGLLKHFSQVPGRLNFTVLNEDSEDQDTDDCEKPDNPESTIVDSYCTQLALAELLGSQELAEISLDEVTDEIKDSGNVLSCSLQSIDDITKVSEEKENPSNGNLVTASLDQISSDIVEQPLEVKEVEDLTESQSRASVIKVPLLVSSQSSCEVATNTSITYEKANGTQAYLLSRFQSDWSNILASSEGSDILILTKQKELPCHSLVLRVRCPDIFNDLCNESGWSQKCVNLQSISYDSVHKFLVYLYTGSVCIDSKDDPCWIDLFDLAIKYNCKDLIAYLESIYKGPLATSDISNNACQITEFKSDFCISPFSPGNEVSSSEGNFPSHQIVYDLSLSPSTEQNIPSESYSPKQLASVPATTESTELNSMSSSLACARRSDLENDEENIQSPAALERKAKSTVSSVCYADSPDIFEESVNYPNLMEAPVVTPTGHFESKCEEHSPDEVEIFIGKGDHIDYRPFVSRRQLFCSIIEKSPAAEKEKNFTSEKLDSEIPIYPNLQISPVNVEEGVVDLTMSSDDSLDYPKDDMGSESLLDQTIPFDSHLVTCNKNLLSETGLLDETLPFKPPSPAEFQVNNQQPASKENFIEISDDIESFGSCKEALDISEGPENDSTKALNFLDIKHASKSLFGKEMSRKTSPVAVLVSSPTKEDSVVSNLWDNFDDDGGNFYCPSPPNEISPLKQNTIVEADSLTNSSPKFIEPVNCYFGSPETKKHNNFTKFIRSPFSKTIQKRDSFSDVGEETLLMAVDELESQIYCKLGNDNVQYSKEAISKKPRLYKSKSCNLENESIRPPKSTNDFFASQTKTPVSLKKWGPHNITPMPDYKTMVSPELKKELDRYGIRKLSRRKAITLLTHIYDQLHPFVSDSEVDSSYVETPDKAKSGLNNIETLKNKRNVPSSQLVKKSNLVEKKASPEKCHSSVDDLNSSQDSINSSVDGSQNECLEETEIFSDDDQAEISATQQDSFENRMKDLIKLDAPLHEKILLYEPIWINELQATAKANGIKCSMQALIDFLDQQCITFRLPTTRNRRKCKKKSPKKKS